MDFELISEYRPTGDQPEAISELTDLISSHHKHSTLLGVTGSGKTFTVANVVANLNRPTLVLSHNKTLAAQLYGEFKNFFPNNAVEYFVSYYDYYQPEAYLPTTDTYIEKDLSINEEIERMRLKTTASLISGRRDVIVVSSVSCLYGIGNPEDFHATSIKINKGDIIKRQAFLEKLVNALYLRTENDLTPSTFRAVGDNIIVYTAYGETCYRIGFFDEEIDEIAVIDPVTGETLKFVEHAVIFPANLFVTTKEKTDRAIDQIAVDLGHQIDYFEKSGRPAEARRIKQRVEFDLEMIKELGYCSGIENYSRYFDGRSPGSRPFCLLDYFPKDYLLVVDESHVTLPQIRGMFGGDRSRKQNLVDYGYRLPAAIDNRPLTFDEFEGMAGQTIYVSATPADYEIMKSEGIIVEQLIRPTGLTDPEIDVRITDHQIDDLIEEINKVSAREQRTLVTTLTKKMAEQLSKYFDKIGIRNRYIHSEIDTLERVQILDDLRAGLFDVLIGVNLLREGIDLPEVSLVAIMDADKEGFLRSERSLTQTAGRAARNPEGRVIMYAEKRTDSMNAAIAETNRRRWKQIQYNCTNRIIPEAAHKSNKGIMSGESLDAPAVKYPIPAMAIMQAAEGKGQYLSKRELNELKAEYKKQMEQAAVNLEFRAAADYRDAIIAIEERLKSM